MTGSGGGCCWECVADSGECIMGSGGVCGWEWGSALQGVGE